MVQNLKFGLADIIIDEDGTNPFKFDGIDHFQAEGGELTFTPELEDLVVADFGGATIFDQAINGYTSEITIIGAERSIQMIKQAMDATTEGVYDTADPTKLVGVTDARIGSKLRAKGKKMRIHPRHMGSDTSTDIVIYKAVANGEFGESYKNEQGNYEIKYGMYPRDGADPNSGANFFYVGSTDPNAAAG